MNDASQMQMLMGGMGLMSAFAGTYVAPPAGEEGGPPGYNPYLPAAEVVIDPDGPATVIRPREITRQLMEKALGGRLKSNQQLSERRVAAADAMQEIARIQATQAKQPISEEFVGDFSPIVMDTSKGQSAQHEPLPGHALRPQANEIVRPERLLKDTPASAMAPAPAPAPAPATYGAVTLSTFNSGPTAIQSAFVPQPSMSVKQAADSAFVDEPVPLQIPVIQEGQLPPRSFPRIPAVPQAATVPKRPEPALPPVAPPSLRIDFEVDGHPFTSQGWYHKAIRNRHTIVLVFDDRCQGYPRVFPPMIDSPMRMHIHGQTKLFEVMSAGHHFYFEPMPGVRYEMDILMIVQEYDLTPEQLNGG